MKIPVVLPVVRIHVMADDDIQVSIDGMPYETDTGLTRLAVPRLLDKLTIELNSPVRVEIQEPDGATYVDIVTPPAEPTVLAADTASGPDPDTRVHAAGFQPDEEVVLVYVLARPRADHEGRAWLRLPPALLTANRDDLLLLGSGSGTIARLT